MTAHTDSNPEPRADDALRLPMGVASPLWFFYASAAGAGLAWWMMTRWARPVNLEAMLGKKAAVAFTPMAEAAGAAVEVAEEVFVAAVEEVEDAVETSVEMVEQAVDEAQAALAAAVETPPDRPLAMEPEAGASTAPRRRGNGGSKSSAPPN